MFLLMACLVGYVWLYFAITATGPGHDSISVCLIKHATTLPCPACGSTRAVQALLHGHFLESLSINPFGVLIAIIMLLAPLWIMADFVAKKTTLLEIYCKIELLVKKPPVAITMIFLVAANWIWNIQKGL